jgi:hypothetical protein
MQQLMPSYLADTEKAGGAEFRLSETLRFSQIR